MDDAVLILSALLLNALIGGPRRLYASLGLHRVAVMPGRAIRYFERKLNREHRTPGAREARGWIMAGAVFISSIVIGAIIAWFSDGGLIELAILTATLPVRPIWDRASGIRESLSEKDVVGARQDLIGTPWRHHALLDEHGVARAAIETTAMDYSEKLVAPIIGYLLLGLPGLFVVKSLTLLRDVLGPATEFGKGARLTHQALHVIPARFTALYWVPATLFLPSGNIAQTAKRITVSFLSEGPRPLIVQMAASVLHVSLGGPSSPYDSRWAEYGSAKALPSDVRRAQVAYGFALVFLFLFVGAFF